MKATININAGGEAVKGELKNTALGQKIYEALPLNAKAKTWGMEIYFEIPVHSPIESPVNEVEKGDIAYWPEGRCLCLFFGPTPMSIGEKPVPASAVEVVGKMGSDCQVLEKIKAGENIHIEEAK